MKSNTNEEKPINSMEKIRDRIIDLIKQNGGKILIQKNAQSKTALKNKKMYYTEKNVVLARLYRIHSKLDIILDQIQPQM